MALLKSPRSVIVVTAAFLLASLALFSTTAMAQSGPARNFLNTPVNAAVFYLDFAATEGETAAGSDLPLPNNEVVSRFGAATLLWSFPLWDRYGGVAFTGNYASVNVKTAHGEVKTSGFGDPGITLHANLFGAPALDSAQFASATPQTFSSFHLTINPPLGEYDRNSAVNVGGNRWAITPLLNLSITPDRGVSWIDLYAGGRFYTNNNEYRGSHHLSEDPLASFTVHYSHNIGQRMYAAIGLCYDTGGETSIDGVPQHDTASGFRPSVSISARMGKYRVTVVYENTSSKPNEEPRNWLLSLKLSGPLFAL